MPLKFRVNHTGSYANPHMLIAGKTRLSGKTTLGETILYHELERGAKAIIFDPKDEWLRIATDKELWDDLGIKVFRAGFESWEHPIKLKPSQITHEIWRDLAERYLLGKGGYKQTATILVKAAKNLEQKEQIISFENIKQEIEQMSTEIKVFSKQQWLTTMWQIEDFFDTLTELDIFDEETGFDINEWFNNYDLAVFTIQSPEDAEHISLLVTNVLHQLFKFKVASDTRRGHGDQLVWKKRVWVVIDEAGDPTVGLVNTESKLACRSAVEQIFGKYAYANIMGMVITQHLQHISTKVIGNCANIYIGKLDEPNAIKKISQLSMFPPTQLNVMFKTFRVGDFFAPLENREMSVILTEGFKGIG